MAKFKVGDKVVRTNGREWVSGEKYKIVERVVHGEYILENGCLNWHDYELELYKEDKEMKELTFMELSKKDIKDEEVWESKAGKNITVNKNGIDIKNMKNFDSIYISFDTKFVLKRKEYTFEEAWKAYEEGKEIEGNSYRYKKMDGKDFYYSKVYNKWKRWRGIEIRIDEICGKWYIND